MKILYENSRNAKHIHTEMFIVQQLNINLQKPKKHLTSKLSHKKHCINSKNIVSFFTITIQTHNKESYSHNQTLNYKSKIFLNPWLSSCG